MSAFVHDWSPITLAVLTSWLPMSATGSFAGLLGSGDADALAVLGAAAEDVALESSWRPPDKRIAACRMTKMPARTMPTRAPTMKARLNGVSPGRPGLWACPPTP
jgi:hypothetical protein